MSRFHCPSRSAGLVVALVVALLTAVGAWGQPAPTAAHPHFAVETSGAGPHVVLVPGLASGPTTWAPTVPALAGYTVHRVTLAGFAGVPRVGDGPFLDAVRDEVAAYVASLDGPAVVVGHSLGGWTAQRVAALRPDGLVGIVVVDALPFLAAAMDSAVTQEQARTRIAPALPVMAAQTPEQTRASQAMALRGLVHDTSAVAVLLPDNGRSDAGAITQAFADLFTTDARPDLPHIAVPTLVVVAGDGYGPDPATAPALYARQYAGLAGVEIDVVPDALHFLMHDQPEAFNALLVGFLGRTLPAAQ